MTITPDADRALVRAFPTPGPLLGTAYRDLYLAAEGSDNQKATIGDPSLLPKPWDPPTCRNPRLRAELWEWLDQVVLWLNHEYVWDPDGMIPPCWPQHPHLVHELAVLADQRRRVGLALDSNGLEEWHRYTLPGFLDRLRARLKAHCDQDHQPWPARGRHARHTNQRLSEGRRGTFTDDLLQPRGEPLTPRWPRLAALPSTGPANPQSRSATGPPHWTPMVSRGPGGSEAFGAPTTPSITEAPALREPQPHPRLSAPPP